MGGEVNKEAARLPNALATEPHVCYILDMLTSTSKMTPSKG